MESVRLVDWNQTSEFVGRDMKRELVVKKKKIIIIKSLERSHPREFNMEDDVEGEWSEVVVGWLVGRRMSREVFGQVILISQNLAQ